MNTTYTKAIIVTYTSPSDAEKHWGFTHPLYDNFIVDLQHEGAIPLSLDEYPRTEYSEGVYKDYFTSAELRDRWLEVVQAVAADLGTPFTYECLDIEPFTYP